jgi:hypothetical protein
MNMCSIILNNYFINVASEFIAFALLIFLAWLIYHLTKRRKLLKFFNLTESKRLVVYLSHLRIVSGGALGIDNVPRSFGESAIPLTEVRLISLFQRLFNFVIPGVDNLPGFLKFLLISDIDVSIIPSPLTTGEIERSATFISIGSPGYNIASTHIENSFSTHGSFTNQNSEISISGIPPMNNTRYAFIQRVFDQSTKQMGFYLAGMSSLGTYGATVFLAKRWKYLAKKFKGTQPFCIVINVTSNDGQQSEIISEHG